MKVTKVFCDHCKKEIEESKEVFITISSGEANPVLRMLPDLCEEWHAELVKQVKDFSDFNLQTQKSKTIVVPQGELKEPIVNGTKTKVTANVTKEELEKLVLTEGLTNKAIIERLGIPQTTLSRYINKYGLQRQTGSGRPKKLLEQVKEELNNIKPQIRAPVVKEPEPAEKVQSARAICCSAEIKKNCIYGGKGMVGCEYLAIEGVMRGCPATACTKYKKGEPISLKGKTQSYFID